MTLDQKCLTVAISTVGIIALLLWGLDHRRVPVTILRNGVPPQTYMVPHMTGGTNTGIAKAASR